MKGKTEKILCGFSSIFPKYLGKYARKMRARRYETGSEGKFASRWRAKSPDALCAVLPQRQSRTCGGVRLLFCVWILSFRRWRGSCGIFCLLCEVSRKYPSVSLRLPAQHKARPTGALSREPECQKASPLGEGDRRQAVEGFCGIFCLV